ncbi:hypothetical protein ACFYO0_40880 [Streptomyces sp. NPDC006365]|uniref:hypothetical protein n=1 Tax=Streptomyces sp. NPDC006365 TaxID=3364744 RepID=UPI00367F3FFC
MRKFRRAEAGAGKSGRLSRSNPLRRRSDVMEAGIVLAAWMLAVAGGAVAGCGAAYALDQAAVGLHGRFRALG